MKMTHSSHATILAIRASCIVLGHGSSEGRRQIVLFQRGEPLSLGIRAHVAHMLNEYGDADEQGRARLLEEWRGEWEEYCGEALDIGGNEG